MHKRVKFILILLALVGGCGVQAITHNNTKHAYHVTFPGVWVTDAKDSTESDRVRGYRPLKYENRPVAIHGQGKDIFVQDYYDCHMLIFGVEVETLEDGLSPSEYLTKGSSEAGKPEAFEFEGYPAARLAWTSERENAPGQIDRYRAMVIHKDKKRYVVGGKNLMGPLSSLADKSTKLLANPEAQRIFDEAFDSFSFKVTN